MLQKLKGLFSMPEPDGPPQVLRTFTMSMPTIAQSHISTGPDGWLIDVAEAQTVRLFEMENVNIDQCVITYRAMLKSENLKGRAFLEMWCRIQGRGEFFSKGIRQPVRGTTDWATYEIPFYLKKGQLCELIKLNVAVEGRGKVWIKDIEVLKTPLSD